MSHSHRTLSVPQLCRARSRIPLAAYLLLALIGCEGQSSSSPAGGSNTGTTQASGGTTGSSGFPSTGGTGGTLATGGTGATLATGGTGTVGSGGSGGTTSAGTGGKGATLGTGGASQGATGGESGGDGFGAAGRSGSGGINGAGGAASGGSGGATGGSGGTTAGGGGSGGKPDQSSLPAVTIHMAGDSTMSDYTAATTQEGWGQEFGQFFTNKVTIDNQAQPGANIQTFYSGRWKTLITNVKAGDYVMAAFGINDSGTTHGPVSPAAFQTQMGVMADEVAAKNATFIPTTSSPLQVWVDGKETNTRLQPYCDATIALGMTKGLLVDDLNARAVEYYNMIGQTAAAALTFNGDKAHFDKQGATEMALLASQELARIHSPLAQYLK
ncbi:MAG TPA: GDSL-type esterase/lipase family protein [Polyangia bacterium]|nr:GDSL-type esterase/lipase family protein [Polyangia bacterium]